MGQSTRIVSKLAEIGLWSKWSIYKKSVPSLEFFIPQSSVAHTEYENITCESCLGAVA